MLNFIKYNRFKIRDHSAPCVPYGPNFSNAKTYTYSLRSSELSFSAPTQVHFFRPGSEQRTPKWKHDDLEKLHNWDISSYNHSWKSRLIFTRKYAFYGPWFSGEKASAAFILGVTAPENENKDLNLLHPRAFETALSGYLTATVGHLHHESDGEPYYRGPINWKPHPNFPVPAVQFTIVDHDNQRPDYYLCFPVAKDRILTLEFSYSQHISGSKVEKDAAISPQSVQELIENIINSVKFTPSAELKKELEEVQKNCQDLSVSKKFPPLKWPATVDETGLNIVEMNEKKRKALAG